MEDTENKVKNEAVAEKGDTKGKVYEVGYLLVPTIREEDLAAAYGNLKETVSSFGGEVIADEMPKMMNIAYPMVKVVSNVRSKFTTAYFGWTKFIMSAAQVVELKAKLDLDPTIIRFLIIKTVKENTIAAKRFGRSETYKKPTTKKAGENEVVTPINKEEIDKEIEALIAA